MRGPTILNGSWLRRRRAPIGLRRVSNWAKAESLANLRFGKPAHARGQFNRSKVYVDDDGDEQHSATEKTHGGEEAA